MPKLRPYTAKVRAARAVKALVENDLNQTKAAQQLGITQQTLHKKLIQPEAQLALAEINRKALAKAGATMEKIYQRAAEGLDATGKTKLKPDFKERRESVKLLGEMTGIIKTANSEDITKPTEIHVHYGHRKPRVSSVRTE